MNSSVNWSTEKVQQLIRGLCTSEPPTCRTAWGSRRKNLISLPVPPLGLKVLIATLVLKASVCIKGEQSAEAKVPEVTYALAKVLFK